MYRFTRSFPGDSAVKESTSNAGDMGFYPRVGKIPRRKQIHFAGKDTRKRPHKDRETLVQKAVKG